MEYIRIIIAQVETKDGEPITISKEVITDEELGTYKEIDDDLSDDDIEDNINNYVYENILMDYHQGFINAFSLTIEEFESLQNFNINE